MRRSREESSQPDYNITYRHPLQNVTFAHRIIMFAGQFKNLAVPIKLSQVNKSFREAAVIFHATGQSLRNQLRAVNDELTSDVFCAKKSPGEQYHEKEKQIIRFHRLLLHACFIPNDGGLWIVKEMLDFLPLREDIVRSALPQARNNRVTLVISKHHNFTKSPVHNAVEKCSPETLKLLFDVAYSQKISLLIEGCESVKDALDVITGREIDSKHREPYNTNNISMVLNFPFNFAMTLRKNTSVLDVFLQHEYFRRFVLERYINPSQRALFREEVKSIVSYILKMPLQHQANDEKHETCVDEALKGPLHVLKFIDENFINRPADDDAPLSPEASFVVQANDLFYASCLEAIFESKHFNPNIQIVQDLLLSSTSHHRTFDVSKFLTFAVENGCGVLVETLLKSKCTNKTTQSKEHNNEGRFDFHYLLQLLLRIPSVSTYRNKLHTSSPAIPEFELKGGFPFWCEMFDLIRRTGKVDLNRMERRTTTILRTKKTKENDCTTENALSYYLRSNCELCRAVPDDRFSSSSSSSSTQDALQVMRFLVYECGVDVAGESPVDLKAVIGFVRRSVIIAELFRLGVPFEGAAAQSIIEHFEASMKDSRERLDETEESEEEEEEEDGLLYEKVAEQEILALLKATALKK